MNAKSIATMAALSLLSFAGLASTALAEGNAAAGQTKAVACGACHGVDGNSVNPEWPSLAGQHASYIVKQLKAFKGGLRKNDMMSPMATGLSPEDMNDVAAYFSSQTIHGLEADKDKFELGQKVYRGGNIKTQTPACLACHGPTGRGNPPAVYPSIQSQHSNYVVAQLNAFKSGTRNTDASKAMNDIASKLSDDEIKAVASYIQGLR